MNILIFIFYLCFLNITESLSGDDLSGSGHTPSLKCTLSLNDIQCILDSYVLDEPYVFIWPSAIVAALLFFICCCCICCCICRCCRRYRREKKIKAYSFKVEDAEEEIGLPTLKTVEVKTTNKTTIEENDKTSTGENKIMPKDKDQVNDTTVESYITADVPKSVNNEEDKSDESQINKDVNQEEMAVVQEKSDNKKEEIKIGEGNQANIISHEKNINVENTQLPLEETKNELKPTSDQKSKEDNVLEVASITNNPQPLPSLDFEAEFNALTLNMALVLEDTPPPQQQQENLDVTSAVNPTSHAALDLMLKDILEFSNTDNIIEKEGELENL